MAKLLRWLNLAALVAMIAVNVLANVLPIGGMNTGEISAQYQNLFTPAGITFAIWSVIYALLGVALIRQLLSDTKETDKLVDNMGILFITSCGLNILWIFLWHYGYVLLSTIVIIALAVNMYILVDRVRNARLMYWAIGIYTGWITVASVASLFVLAVSLGWNGTGTLAVILTILAITVCAIVCGTGTLMSEDYGYGLAVMWALTGILIKHITDFNGRYFAIMVAALLGVGIVGGFIIRSLQENYTVYAGNGVRKIN